MAWPSGRCLVKSHLKCHNRLNFFTQMKYGKRIRVEVREKRRKAMSQQVDKGCEKDGGGKRQPRVFGEWPGPDFCARG